MSHRAARNLLLSLVATAACFSETAGSSSSSGSNGTAGTSGTAGTAGTAGDLCGNGTIDADEECDLGAANSDNAGCTSTCTLARCGDGLVYIGVEACDDGNDVDDDECTSSCAIPTCGDGVLDPGEECDQGQDNADNAECTTACKNATCGDGLMGPGEACDGTQGCTDQCTLAGCGNGMVDPGEECDPSVDGAEACDLDCTPAECGDGTLNTMAGESCDDGNTDPGDGCHSDCTTYKLVFVSSLLLRSTPVGKGTGLENMDAACQGLASIAGLPGQYRAWLSTQDSDVKDRLSGSPIPIRLLDGTLVANNGAELIEPNSPLAAAIALTETGEQPTPTDASICDGDATVAVWTGSTPAGTFAKGLNGTAGDCGGWADGGGTVAVGDASRKDARWTSLCANTCDGEGDAGKAHIYCFMQ